MMLIKNVKINSLSKETSRRIDNDLKELDKLPKGIYTKIKHENEASYYIKVLIDKDYLKIEKTNKNYSLIPDMINFLIILDYTYPKYPPKILCQTNVSTKYNIYIVLFSKFNGREKFNFEHNTKMDT